MKYPGQSTVGAFVAGAALAFSAHAATPAATAAPPPTQSMGAQAMGVKFGGFFDDRQKAAARKAFAQNYAKAKECPAGLEKKAKGCASPWDKRYWAVGQALQPAVTVYPVPEPVASQLPPAPKGYEYVRAADDILLIATGSKLVVDMIEHVAG